MKRKTNISVKNNLGYHVTSNMEVGSDGVYASGDILDANATAKLIDDKISSFDGTSSAVKQLLNSVQNIQSLINADDEDIDIAIDKFEEIVSFLDGIEPGSELYDIILSHIDGGQSKVVKHIEVISQSDYNNLQVKDPNTEYNII